METSGAESREVAREKKIGGTQAEAVCASKFADDVERRSNRFRRNV